MSGSRVGAGAGGAGGEAPCATGLPRTRDELAQHIPQREPFLFVDQILAFTAERSVRSLLRLTGREPFFAGHFPERPTLPGVLLLEHMAQSAAFLVSRSRFARDERRDPPLMYFAGIDRARFLAPVHPAASIVTDIGAIKLFDTMALFDAESRVDGQPVARARLSFAAPGAAGQRAAAREGE